MYVCCVHIYTLGGSTRVKYLVNIHIAVPRLIITMGNRNIVGESTSRRLSIHYTCIYCMYLNNVPQYIFVLNVRINK